jgi:hypothetical protein
MFPQNDGRPVYLRLHPAWRHNPTLSPLHAARAGTSEQCGFQILTLPVNWGGGGLNREPSTDPELPPCKVIKTIVEGRRLASPLRATTIVIELL